MCHKTSNVFLILGTRTHLNRSWPRTRPRAITQKRERRAITSYDIAIIVEDWAESPAVMASHAGGNALNTLLARRRHMMISAFMLA